MTKEELLAVVLVLAVGLLLSLALAWAIRLWLQLWDWLVAGIAGFRDEWGGNPRILICAPRVWRNTGRWLWRFTVETREATRILLRFRTASRGERRLVADSIYGVLLLVLWGMLIHWIAHS